MRISLIKKGTSLETTISTTTTFKLHNYWELRLTITHLPNSSGNLGRSLYPPNFCNHTTSSSPSPTNGKFNIFWDNNNLSASHVSTIKKKHSNVKVAVSLGGDSMGDESSFFSPSSVDSWVSNVVSSLTNIIQEFNLDGNDIDYEHFRGDPETFAKCIRQLIKALKKNRVISFASIAPFDDDQVQIH
ncbi:hypothetical protein ACET3Z_024881 [Daucus carota]